MSRITLGYWKIRGLGQAIRYVLNYVGQDFDEVRYEMGDGPEYSRDAWDKVKHTLGLPFPNLPYLIDGDLKLTQSNAILRYLGAKHKLLGADLKAQAYNDMLLDVAMDLRNALVSVVYNADYDKLIDEYFVNVVPKFKLFEDFLNTKDWFAGGKTPSVCDFHIYELLDQHRLMRPNSLKDFPKLKAFLDRFEALPKIKAYMQSDKFIKRPVNNKSAGWK